MVLIFLHISTVHIRKLLRKCAFTGKFKDNILVLNRKIIDLYYLAKQVKQKQIYLIWELIPILTLISGGLADSMTPTKQ